jgi:citrate lyase subunit beta/citryl-CoA lyase
MRLITPLFAPGDQPRKIEKALASEADAVILDLEDAIAPGQKEAARSQVAASLPTLARPHRAARNLIVRVNPRGSAWYLADLAAVVPGKPDGILLPKCEGPEDLEALDHHLEALEAAHGLPRGGIVVLALVTETAASVRRLADYRSVPPRVRAFCFAAEDLSADLGIRPRDAQGNLAAPLQAARSALLVTSAALGLAALDTPYPDPKDPAGLERELAAAVADGFSGKILIHPAQIAPTRAAFTPSAEAIAWARAVKEGFAAHPEAGTFALEGKMIDRPHLKLAERILAAAGEANA